MSSIIERARTNKRTERGILVEKNDKIPRINAVSVATGIAQPRVYKGTSAVSK